MRLKTTEAGFIKQTAKACFGKDTTVYLFGSRTDVNQKGGDIDLYIETNRKEGIFDKKILMLRQLHERLGDQKIDIVVNNFVTSLPIYEVAKKQGIML